MAAQSKLRTLASNDVPDPWEPPSEGTIKINCAAAIPPGGAGACRYSAIARDYSGELVGVSYGKLNHEVPPFLLQLKSVEAGVTLGKKMTERDLRPWAFEVGTNHEAALEIARCVEAVMGYLDTVLLLEGEDAHRANAVLLGDDGAFDRDGEFCVTLIGKELPGPLPRCFLDAIEHDKLLVAGSSRNQARASEEEINSADVGCFRRAASTASSSADVGCSGRAA